MGHGSPLATDFVCYASDRYVLYYYPPRNPPVRTSQPPSNPSHTLMSSTYNAQGSRSVSQEGDSTGLHAGTAGSGAAVLSLRSGAPLPKVRVCGGESERERGWKSDQNSGEHSCSFSDPHAVVVLSVLTYAGDPAALDATL